MNTRPSLALRPLCFRSTAATWLRKSIVTAILFSPALLVGSALGGTLGAAKIALHAKTRAGKAVDICTTESPNGLGINCQAYTTQWPTGIGADVYVMVAEVDSVGFAGISMGIDYDPVAGQGVDVLGWTSCGDLEFPNSGANGNWPAAGGGNRVAWDGIGNCQTTLVAGDSTFTVVVGAFYVYAYNDDIFEVTKNRNLLSGPELVVADCSAAESDIPDTQAGIVGFGSAAGCNPCLAACNHTIPPLVIDFVRQPAVRPEIVTLNVMGTSLGASNLTAKLIEVPTFGTDTLFATQVANINVDEVQVTFDLTGETPGSWDLSLSNVAGTDLLLRAIVVYDDAPDLFRTTVSPFGADRFPSVSPAGAGFDSVTFVSSRDRAMVQLQLVPRRNPDRGRRDHGHADRHLRSVHQHELVPAHRPGGRRSFVVTPGGSDRLPPGSSW
jgi:hypothetical protein